VSSITISGFINDPWRDIGQDAMKRGAEICKRNELMNPDANMVMLIGICDIINELKSEEAKP